MVVQMKSFFVLRRGQCGASSGATFFVLVESWFATPKNDQGSMLVDAVRNLKTAYLMDEQIC